MRFLRPGLPFLLAVALLLFVPALTSRGPWHVDELRYAEVARQMGEYGHTLVPHLNGEVYREKPPLYFLLVALLEKPTGDWIVAGRLLAALSMVLSALLLVPLSRKLIGRPEPGWLGALVFLTTLMAIDRGQQGLLDSLLVALTTGAAVALLLGAGAESPWRRWGLTAVAALLMGAGILTKGPVGALCPVIGVIAAGLVIRGRRGVPWLPLLASIAVASAIGIVWLLLATAEAGDWYLRRMLFAQTAGRAVSSWAHAKSFFYYVPSVLRYMLPWTLLLPGAAWLAWRRRGEPGGRGALAAGAFAVAGIVAFSLISGKRPAYVLPFYPPLALLVGWGIHEYAAGERFFRSRAADRLPFGLLAWLPAVLGLALPILAVWFQAGAVRIGIAVLVGVGAGLAARAAARALGRGEASRSTVLVIAGIALLTAGAHVAVVSAMDPDRSPAEFGAVLARNLEPAEPYLLLGSVLEGRVNFYTDRERFEVVEAETLGAAADRPGRARVVAEDDRWEEVPTDIRERFAPQPGTRTPVGRRVWCIYLERR